MADVIRRLSLHWLGHVARMPFERLPRKMLSSWVAAPRASGGQLMTYGRSIQKALDHFGIDRTAWATLAADRAAWRDAIHGGLLAGGRPTRGSAAATNRLIADSLANERGARGRGRCGLRRGGRDRAEAPRPP